LKYRSDGLIDTGVFKIQNNKAEPSIPKADLEKMFRAFKEKNSQGNRKFIEREKQDKLLKEQQEQTKTNSQRWGREWWCIW